MSRSIHTTRKTLRQLRRQDFADPDEKAEVLRKARQQLRQKRIIKWRTDLERSRIELPVAGARVDLIPIEVCNQGPYIHHVCSEADIRAVLSALPEAAVEGISRIQLGLSKAYHEESRRGMEDQADPFTGRRSGEVFPGVYSGMILGTYYPRNALIQLNAFVFDPKELPFEADLICLYLRLHTLATLVHEVAHHHDFRERVGRGRWIFARHENAEGYAEKMEYVWSREVVLAYLQRAYPQEVDRFLSWVEQHGGVRLPLEFFIGDPRTTMRDGSERLVFNGHSAFERWVARLPECKDQVAAWMAFAYELKWAERYELSLELIDKVLTQAPSYPGARSSRADALVRLNRLDEAFELARVVALENPRDVTGFRVLARIHELRKEWEELLAVCDQWKLALTKLYDFSFNTARSVALCALGKEAELEAELEQFRLHISVRTTEAECRKRMETRRQAILRRAGRGRSTDA